MLQSYEDDDAVVNMVERRFFAALAAAQTVQGECAVLHEVMVLAVQAWRGARARAATLETMSDALGKQLAELTRKEIPSTPPVETRLALSA